MNGQMSYSQEKYSEDEVSRATHELIHARAVRVGLSYRHSISELIDCLQEVDAHKTHRAFDCTSLLQYATRHIGLSVDVALNHINVARKAIEVPALKQEIRNGALTVSKARKICSVLNVENQGQWLELARTLSTRELEREVVKVNPRAAVIEKASYVTADRWLVQFGASETLMGLLRSAQDLVSTSQKKAANFEATFEVVLNEYIQRHDPVKKAQRIEARALSRDWIMSNNRSPVPGRSASPSASPDPSPSTPTHPSSVTGRIASTQGKPRKPLAASLQHQLNLRDQGRCTEKDAIGNRCASTRWLDFHHLIPVHLGGKDCAANLTTLCRAHHQIWHGRNSAHSGH